MKFYIFLSFFASVILLEKYLVKKCKFSFNLELSVHSVLKEIDTGNTLEPEKGLTQLKVLNVQFDREVALGTLTTEIIEALKTIVSPNIIFSSFSSWNARGSLAKLNDLISQNTFKGSNFTG